MKTKNIFLTGATGQIGKELLKRLLFHKPYARFNLLIRAGRRLSAFDRFQQLLGELVAVSPFSKKMLQSRVFLIEGNLASPDLSLSSKQLSRLAQETDSIYHLGASVALNDPLQKLRQVNLMGTASMLKLARLAHKYGGIDRFVYLSTAYVAGQRTGRIYESDLIKGQDFNNPYERVKFEAEQLVESEKKRLPISIIRPSMVVGNSQTGKTAAFNVIYGPLRLLYQGRLSILPCRQDSIVDLVPLDYVCKAIQYLGESPDSIGDTFHITAGAGREIAVVDLIDFARNYMQDYYSRQGVKRKIAAPKMIQPAFLLHNAAKQTAKDSLSRQLATYAKYTHYVKHFDNSQAACLLEPIGIVAPNIKDYIVNICRFALEKNFGVKPYQSTLL